MHTALTCSRPTRVVERHDSGTPMVTWNGFCTRLRWHRGDHIDRTQVARRPWFTGPERNLNRFVMGLWFLALVLTFFAANNFVQYANAAEVTRCADAWQAPHSQVAKDCRHRGWVVRSHIVVSKRAVVRHNTLPACRVEDSVGCYWDAARRDNQMGASFVNLRTRTGHPKVVYVWLHRPNRNGWSWVGSHPGLADALAEGSVKDATTRAWTRCVVRYSDDTVVRCADGLTVTS